MKEVKSVICNFRKISKTSQDKFKRSIYLYSLFPLIYPNDGIGIDEGIWSEKSKAKRLIVRVASEFDQYREC